MQYTIALVDKDGLDVVSLNMFLIGIIEGLDDIVNDVVADETAISDGSIFQGVFQQQRQIIIPLTIFGTDRETFKNNYHSLRKFLIKQNEFFLVMKDPFEKIPNTPFKRIKVAMVGFTKIFLNQKFVGQFTLELLASNPLYEIIPQTTFSTPTAEFANGYGWFPETLIEDDDKGKFYTRVYEVFSNSNEINIENRGEELGDIEFVFRNTNTSTTSFIIENKTRGLVGSRLEFVFNLQVNERLFFATKTGKLVIIDGVGNETNAYDFLISGNAYDFKMAIGNNEIVWIANNTDFSIDFKRIEYLR